MSGARDLMLEITPQVLLKAYACGIFPMAESSTDPGLFWVEPERRGILPLDNFHLPRSLRKAMRHSRMTISIDRDFASVIDECAAATPERPNTWINRRIRSLYLDLHKAGYCHSVECYLDDELVGGLYGVRLGGAFFGESMFSRTSNASKIALAHLVARLRTGRFVLLDTQFRTDHLASLGAIEIDREEYNERLARAIEVDADFFAYDDLGGGTSSDSILQSFSQMS
jgi:leucyl/phenylalanyl-tRNA---protein transferase